MLLVWGAYTRKGLFSEFYCILLALLSPWRKKDHSESLNQNKKLMCHVCGGTNQKSKSRKG